MSHRLPSVLLLLSSALIFACGPSTDDNNNNEPMGRDTSMDQQDWEMCVGSTTRYEKFEESISSIARVQGFERVADTLWRMSSIESEDFVEANTIYVEEEGLDSRVSRREDEHYPAVMEGGETLSCRDAGVPQKDPERCVGPAQIKPAVLDALTRGGKDEGVAAVNAAQVEANLLWFLYVSTYKEATTCAVAKKDCDSSWAYYSGGEQRTGGIGLADYYKEHAPAAHEKTFDGLLAVRCWREVDSQTESSNDSLHAQALAKLDEGLDEGMAGLLVWRLSELEAHTGDEQAADWAFLQVLGPALQRAATARDAGKAATLEPTWSKDVDSVDAAATRALITEIFGL